MDNATYPFTSIGNFRSQFSFHADILFSERAETLGEGVLGIEACVLETGEESFAAGTHAFDDGEVQCQVKFPFVRLSAPAYKENVVVSRNEEDDFVDAVGGNDQCVVDFGEIFAVIDNANKTATNGIARFVAGELGSS